MKDSESAGLPSVPYPRLDRLFRTSERIWHDREDVRDQCGQVTSWAFWYWLLWHGAREYEEVRASLYRPPPENLTRRVVGKGDEDAYRQSGLVNSGRILRCLADAGCDLAGTSTEVLDFGCGCGRLLQCFARYADRCRLVGADVDEQAIAWCRSAFDFAEFAVLPKVSPSDFETARFDVIYAYSVFSHLPEQSHRAWLEELHRIAKPGAVLVLTTMGRNCLQQYASGKRLDEAPSASQVAADLTECERTGFLFYPYGALNFGESSNAAFFDSWDLDQYGSTFILPTYVREHWVDVFQLVAIHEAPDRWQDYVILRR